ncbi:hypothetical protein, partial [Dyadobacter frigoris]|uniref:hypothetical protein n=1 Tax=Dyadobacter frigoris TaxID=2576211 RepID=UPI002556F4B4
QETPTPLWPDQEILKIKTHRDYAKIAPQELLVYRNLKCTINPGSSGASHPKIDSPKFIN